MMANRRILPFLVILFQVLVTIAAAADDSDTAVATTATTTITTITQRFRHGKLSITLPPKPSLPTPVTCPIGDSWCINKPNDTYANPCECSSFINCVNGTTFRMRCPFRLFFNPKGNFCDWLPNVRSCYPSGPSPPRPKPRPPRQPSPSPRPRPLPSPPSRKRSPAPPKVSPVRSPPRVASPVKPSPVKPSPKLPSPARSVFKPPGTLEP
ncbi:hypothetical protein Vretimale_17032 [Volvox reticuliferus]|uniref:Uncharacterized protein n=1 Tax=Volvox reticuliferus TaxID=1737510 RepID=A0A8J4FJ49_9CHLO|nr:hypothetical protein Vretifemale_7818 [Volvox reticuliferus]GIM13928.1 hypothetical protein Vretimale_17032 [Volvox reticuliferus]